MNDDLIEFFEGCRLDVYLDSNGYKTVGVGHKLPSNTTLEVGDLITQAQSDTWYTQDQLNAQKRVYRSILIPLESYELKALTSQAFNLTSFEMLADHLQIEGRAKYKEKMLLYCKDHKGVTYNGLLIRRIAERLLFENKYWLDIAKQLQAKDSLDYSHQVANNLFNV